MYNEKIMDYFYNPKNVGRFTTKDITIGSAGTKENGEMVEIQIKVENGIIEDSRFLAYGGVVLIASASWLTEWLQGKSLSEVCRLGENEVSAILEVPANKKTAVSLVIDAIKSAVKNFMEK